MNASMARRIRNAESLLISAIDREYDRHRDWSQRTQPEPHVNRFAGASRNEDRRICDTRNKADNSAHYAA